VRPCLPDTGHAAESATGAARATPPGTHHPATGRADTGHKKSPPPTGITARDGGLACRRGLAVGRYGLDGREHCGGRNTDDVEHFPRTGIFDVPHNRDFPDRFVGNATIMP
jgi:hypothetical protein